MLLPDKHFLYKTHESNYVMNVYLEKKLYNKLFLQVDECI